MEFLTALLKSMPGAVGQGLIWGIMAIGVYITYRILDVADLTVDGSLATGRPPAYCWPSTASTSGSPPCAPFWPGCWRDWSPAGSTPGAGSPPSWPGS